MVLELYLKSSCKIFSIDYRRIFISLLKSAFENTDYESLVLSHNRIPKPYTFSVRFEDLEIKDDKLLFNGNMAYKFSTAVPAMISYLYNMFLKTNIISNCEIMHKRLFLPPETPIKGNKVLFKIVGHAVFVKPGGKILEDVSEGVEESINHILRKKIEYFKENFKGFIELPRSYRPVRIVEANLEKSVVRHYGGMIDAFRGNITLEGELEILDFLKKVGIGVRTGQGFGMVRMVRTWVS